MRVDQSAASRQDTTTEAAVLGTLLLYGDSDEVAHGIARLASRDFVDPRHVTVFRTIRAIHRRGDPVDDLSLHNELKITGGIAYAGGPAYLANLTDRAIASVGNLEHYVGMLQRFTQRRALVDTVARLSQLVKDDTQDIGKILAVVESELASVRSNSDFTSRTVVDEAYLDSIADPLPRTPTGFPILDRHIGDGHGDGGLVQGSVVILAGAPKVGKSTVASCIAESFIRHGGTVLVYDYENGQRRYFQRLTCRLAGLGPLDIRQGRLTRDQSDRWQQAKQDVLTWTNNNKLVYRDGTSGISALTPEQLEISVASARSRIGDAALLCVLDSLQKLPMNLEQRRAGIDAWLRSFEPMAQRHNATILALSEITYSQKGGFDSTSNFKESSGIAYTGHLAIKLLEDHDCGNGQMTPLVKLLVSHNRDGRSGEVPARYEMVFPNFGYSELGPDEAEIVAVRNTTRKSTQLATGVDNVVLRMIHSNIEDEL